jgi:hypothetical protein
MRTSRTTLRCLVLICTGLGCGSTSTSPTTPHDSGAGADVTKMIVIDLDAGAKPDASRPDASRPDSSRADVSQVDATQTPDAPAMIDAGLDAALTTYPSFLPNVPQVVSAGGPVIAAPLFIPVIFSPTGNADPYASQIAAFVAAVATSDYWKAVGADYGVGAATASPPIVLDESLPATLQDQQLQVWLANRIGTDPRFGALGGSVFDAGPFDAGAVDATAPLSDAASKLASPPTNAVYVLFTREGTTLELQGGSSCADTAGGFNGYHNSFTYKPSGATVVYAAVPRCSDLLGPPMPLTGFDAVSATATHELAEAATDPMPNHDTAYKHVDEAHYFWEEVFGGGEVGDLCRELPQAFFQPSEPALSSYWVQRIWSNSAAAAGHDPCVPALPLTEEPYYFNSVPELTSTSVAWNGQNLQTLALTATRNVPTTFTLDLFSDATTDGQEWTVMAEDAMTAMTGAPGDLTFSPPSVKGANGYKVTLTVTSSGSDGKTVHPFFVVSTSGLLSNYWIGVVNDG